MEGAETCSLEKTAFKPETAGANPSESKSEESEQTINDCKENKTSEENASKPYNEQRTKQSDRRC